VANKEQRESRALVLKRAADFIAQLIEQTVMHQEARMQIVSRLENWNDPDMYIRWAEAIKTLAEADRQLAEGVAKVVAAVASVGVLEKPKVFDFDGLTPAGVARKFGLDEKETEDMIDQVCKDGHEAWLQQREQL